MGPNKYARLNEPIPKATAGLSTPFEPKKEAITIPRSNDPPITTPDRSDGVLPYITDAMPKVKKNVPTSSARTIPHVAVTTICGIPTVFDTTNIARAAPMNCAIIYQRASLPPIFFIDQAPMVTAGLICVPDIEPIVYTKSPKTSPANIGVAGGKAPASDNPTVNASVNVPNNSAIYFFIP